ncbi:LysE family translocator [Rhodococcus maanshanensis]|uniref:Threonine/homoserine/homoserine lactone efflux protein n=1 Tax=Rhodococcus maanshanensis TaxID=183556 RepID=A0A1H7LV73_9NOCA|nr:LysE family translocator [Rhodococcus maanshanensis]SEL02840.1 Threonine/homoserine/homoserine lactone efflux protein [Rhodococcus maanshanensis]
MTYSWLFLAVAVVLVLTPGADFALIVRNSVSGGRRHGIATTFGVSSAAAVQGLLVSFGIASVIIRVHPIFLAIKWFGIAYLAWIGCSMLFSAARGHYAATSAETRPARWTGYRQGFLCNATNPKIFVFYLSLLPQFVQPDAPWWVWLLHAWTLPFLGTLWCLLVVAFVGSLRQQFERPAVRRTIDTAAGVVMLGFCSRLAREA